MLAGDPAYNGRFIAGVLTTGIYCLPSCSARKPKPENVRFFATAADARAAGLRPCKLCRPDHFEQGMDEGLDRLEAIAAELRAKPGEFAAVEDLADKAAVSPSTLHQQFRLHYHTSPGSYLVQARIAEAKRMLRATAQDAAHIGFDVGFDSTSGFYESFRKYAGMTPAAYRSLASAGAGEIRFEVLLPDKYPLPELLKVLGRDPGSASERLEGSRFTVAYSIDGSPQVLKIDFASDKAYCALDGDSGVAAHEVVARLVNLRQDPTGFERQMHEEGFASVLGSRAGMRIPQTPTVFDGFLWTIIGQQINLRFASVVRRKLAERAGIPAGDLFCIPEPAAVAALDEADLLAIQFSRQKARYLLGAARSFASGELDREKLQELSATSLEKALRAVHGLGTWSINYLMMRTFGFADCAPLGDTGLSSGLQKFLKLESRPNAKECGDLMKRFAPWRSLATYHLWRSQA